MVLSWFTLVGASPTSMYFRSRGRRAARGLMAVLARKVETGSPRTGRVKGQHLSFTKRVGNTLTRGSGTCDKLSPTAEEHRKGSLSSFPLRHHSLSRFRTYADGSFWLHTRGLLVRLTHVDSLLPIDGEGVLSPRFFSSQSNQLRLTLRPKANTGGCRPSFPLDAFPPPDVRLRRWCALSAPVGATRQHPPACHADQLRLTPRSDPLPPHGVISRALLLANTA